MQVRTGMFHLFMMLLSEMSPRPRREARVNIVSIFTSEHLQVKRRLPRLPRAEGNMVCALEHSQGRNRLVVVVVVYLLIC